MSILITAANAAQAYQLQGVLNSEGHVFLGDYQDIPDLMVKSGLMIKTPNPNDSSFIHKMLALCLDKSITAIYPLRKAELLLLAEARLLFTEFDITLYIPEMDIINADEHTIADGKIVVIENGSIVAGDLTHDSLLADELRNGIFSINNNGDHQIFTVD